MFNITTRKMKDLVLFGLVLVILGGCATAKVDKTKKTTGPLPRPDMVIVNDFAVTSAEVKLDQGVVSKAMRDSDSRSISEEEDKVGHMVASKLSEFLVEELREAGIEATRASSQVMPSSTTLMLTGQFITIDEGNQTARVWVGFAWGQTDLRTRIQVFQDVQLIAEAETVARSSLKPGMLTSLGIGGAASTVVPIVIGGVTTGVSEAFLAVVEKDAKRTAKEVAKEVKKAYQDRGWLP
ncbi:MAG: DUF4410 domain-containing protein [Deltaproteobacteria bacterium]|nr:DUF4410 domain-containing protein [Deltaproteobacteria bacterium]